MNVPVNSSAAARSIDYAALPQASLLELLRRGDADAYRHVITINNQRLFRTARAFVSSDSEAEDVVQAAYVCAFERLATFRGDAALSTWLVRIVVNEARQRLRDRKHEVDVESVDRAIGSASILPFPIPEDPSMPAARAELCRLLEEAIAGLSPDFRAVFVLREIEECSVDETAESLGIKPETVKTRLHRARRFIRAQLEQRVAASLKDAFHFQGARCVRITERVLASPRMQDVLAQCRAAPTT